MASEEEANKNEVEEGTIGILKDILFAIKIGEVVRHDHAPIISPSKKASLNSADEQIQSFSQERLSQVLMQKFDVDPTKFENIASQVDSSNAIGEVDLCIESLKSDEFSFPREEEWIECRLSLGSDEVDFTPTCSATSNGEWYSDSMIPVTDIFNSLLEIHIWHVFPKDESDNFGKTWLRSLDSLGQRLRSSFKNSGIASHPQEEETSLIGGLSSQDSPPFPCSPNAEKDGNFFSPTSLFKRSSTNDLSGLAKKDKGTHCHEGWMHSAFASFRQSKKKQSFSRSSSFEINAETSIGDSPCNDGQNDELQPIHGSGQECDVSIQAKNEVSVQRQFSPPSNGETLRRQRSGSESLFGSFRTKSLKISPKKDLQFWKRINSFQEKITEALESRETAEDGPEEAPPVARTPQRRSSLVREPFLGSLNTREKLGSLQISLVESFAKSNCSNWTSETKALLGNSSRKEVGSQLRDKVTVSLRWRAKAENPRHGTAFDCFRIALEKLFDPELAKQSPSKENLCLLLPVNDSSKLILKKIAFAFDLTDAEVSLASWLTINSRITARKVGTSDPTNIGSKAQLATCVHPEYLHNWLLKLDSLGSHYTNEEHKRLGESLYRFVTEEMLPRFKRLHASFPLTQNSQLILFLRCSLLISESASLLHAVRQHVEINPHWTVTCLMEASKEHAKNWSRCLIEEMSLQHPVKSFANDAEAILPPSCKSLASGVNKVEIVLTAINDFLILGEKIYEPTFQSELNVSYMSSVWRTIGETSTHFLEPLRKEMLSLYPEGLQRNQVRELLDMHPSLWILLLQLSKLYRFQERNEAQEYLNWYLPDTFCEVFLLVTYLWADFAVVRAMGTMKLEIEGDSFDSNENESSPISSSAQEIVNLIKVMQERLGLLSFPGGFVSKSKISEFLLPKMLEIIRKYKANASQEVLKKCQEQNTVTLEMSTLASNMSVICREMGDFFASLYITRDRCREKLDLLENEVKDLCMNLFSKRLPGLPHLIASGLSKTDDEDAKLFITSGVMSILQPVEMTANSSSQTVLSHFWQHLFSIFKNQQRKLVKISEFRRLGIILDALSLNFRSYYGLQHSPEFEEEYQSFMEQNLIKSLPSEDVIQRYFSERYEEQCNIHSSASEQLVVNAYYNKGGKGLVVSVYMAPYVEVHKMVYPKISSCRSSCSNIYEDPHRKSKNFLARQAKEMLQNTKDEAESLSSKFIKKASGIITSMHLSQGTGIYVKASLEPQEWFKDTKAKKTKRSTQNPPVFDEDLQFNITPEWMGVRQGGFLVLKLKVANASFTCVHSEAVIPLLRIPVTTCQGKRSNPHTYLGLSRPEAFHDYKSLLELESRYEDKGAAGFLNRLKDSFFIS